MFDQIPLLPAYLLVLVPAAVLLIHSRKCVVEFLLKCRSSVPANKHPAERGLETLGFRFPDPRKANPSKLAHNTVKLDRSLKLVILV